MKEELKMHINENFEKLNRIRSDEGRAEYLRLDMNENPEGLPIEFFNRVMKKVTPQTVAMYPEIDELTDIIAKRHQVKSENAVITNGSDEALRTIFEIFGENGKKTLSVTPSFAMYKIYSSMFGMENENVFYDDNFEVSAEEICEKITEDTRIVSLVNPNNPLGNVYNSGDVEKILKTAGEKDALVIIDEAYHYFYPETFAGLIKKYDNLIVTRTFSKLCSIAGLRIGYALGSAPVIKLMKNALCTYNVNTIGVLFATEILKDKELIPELIRKEKEGREFIKSELRSRGYEFISKEGNFLFIRTKSNFLDMERKLKENKILVKTYSQPMLDGYIRISTGGIESMKKFSDCFFKLDE